MMYGARDISCWNMATHKTKQLLGLQLTKRIYINIIAITTSLQTYLPHISPPHFLRGVGLGVAFVRRMLPPRGDFTLWGNRGGAGEAGVPRENLPRPFLRTGVTESVPRRDLNQGLLFAVVTSECFIPCITGRPKSLLSFPFSQWEIASRWKHFPTK